MRIFLRIFGFVLAFLFGLWAASYFENLSLALLISLMGGMILAFLEIQLEKLLTVPKEEKKECKMNLASAGNSETACLQTLLNKGYKISADEDEECFKATKDGNLFSAENGIELLGLVALWEHYGDDWQEALEKLEKSDPWQQIG